jgi:hypothetical protein
MVSGDAEILGNLIGYQEANSVDFAGDAVGIGEENLFRFLAIDFA